MANERWFDNHRTLLKAFSIQILSTCFGAFVSVAVGQEPGPESLFGLTNLSEIHLELSSEEWAKLQPPAGTDWDVGRAFKDIERDAIAGRNFHSKNSTRPGLAGYLGIDHQYGKADITIDGESVPGAGLRYKGNGTFIEGRERGEYSFKIDFNEYDPEQEFRGLRKLNLQNNVTDESMLREALSYELFREAGIPCPRVGWAKVSLSVPGLYDREDLGIYSIVEQVDKRFLKARFGSAKGLLLKPSTFGTFRYFGEDWEDYEKAYFPKSEPSEMQKQRVIDFARLIQLADQKTFDEEIYDYLDVDVFTRFLAINVLLSNLDSFLGGAQNYYVYLDSGSGKFQVWPWDLDHSFGAFDLVGSPETRRNLSIHEPHWGSNRIIERMMKVPRFREGYHRYLERYLGTLFAKEKIRRQIAEVSAFLRPLVQENGKRELIRFDKLVAQKPSKKEPHALNLFVAERRASVRRQLANESDGEVLRWDGGRDFEGFIAAAVIVLAALLLNLGVYIWAAVAGFRGSAGWGFLNLLFYPVAPLIYGLGIRKDHGKRPAIAVLVSVGTLAIAVAWAVL